MSAITPPDTPLSERNPAAPPETPLSVLVVPAPSAAAAAAAAAPPAAGAAGARSVGDRRCVAVSGRKRQHLADAEAGRPDDDDGSAESNGLRPALHRVPPSVQIPRRLHALNWAIVGEAGLLNPEAVTSPNWQRFQATGVTSIAFNCFHTRVSPARRVGSGKWRRTGDMRHRGEGLTVGMGFMRAAASWRPCC